MELCHVFWLGRSISLLRHGENWACPYVLPVTTVKLEACVEEPYGCPGKRINWGEMRGRH